MFSSEIALVTKTIRQRDQVHFYLAVRSIIAKLTKGNAPDTAQMNAKVREMISEALRADGVEEIIKMGEEGKGRGDGDAEVNLFDDDYLARIEKIKLPNTKIKLLQKLLTKAISDFRKVNRAKGVDFSKQLQSLVEKYNEREDASLYRGDVADDFADSIIDRYMDLIAKLKCAG